MLVIKTLLFPSIIQILWFSLLNKNLYVFKKTKILILIYSKLYKIEQRIKLSLFKIFIIDIVLSLCNK